MRCPQCGSADTKVTDSRDSHNGIRRRRECNECQNRFTTYERIQERTLTVTKRDYRREGFDPSKLGHGIRIACAKRPVSARAVEKLVEEIETEIHRLGQSEVTTDTLGRMVMDRLKVLDRVAYIRFASVYRDFQDIESFEKAVIDLRDDNTQLPLLEDAPIVLRTRLRRGRRPPIPYRAEQDSGPADESLPDEPRPDEPRPDESRPVESLPVENLSVPQGGLSDEG